LEVDEVQKLIDSPALFLSNIKQEIKTKFPFPNGTDEANLGLMGISFKEIDSTFSRLNNSELRYKIVEGSVLPEPKQIKKFEAICDVFTKSEYQNQVHEAVTQLAESVNRLAELREGARNHIHFLTNLTGGLIQVGYIDDKVSAKVAHAWIENIGV
jgi:hypothetical protein